MTIVTTNIYRPEFDYLSSVVNVTFHRVSENPSLIIDYVYTSPYDGQASWVWNNGKYVSGSIQIDPPFQTQSYLFLHELGHVLGLFEHRSGSVNETLMFANGGGYSRSFLDTIKAYGSMDIIDLWGVYGTSTKYKGIIRGDDRGNLLYGGTGQADTMDGNDTIYGGRGVDTLYGNSGNDLIYGGRGSGDSLDASDFIYAGMGNDTVYGNGGNDTCYSGSGSDVFYGGNGKDVFFSQAEDVFADYQAGIDSWIFI